MSGRRGRPGRNNNSESKYADEDYLNEYWRHRAEEEEEENNNNNVNNGNNGNNEWPENNYNYNLEYQEWRAQQEAAAGQPNYYNEEDERRNEQQALRNVRRAENVNRALANRLPAVVTGMISEFEGPVPERRVNIHPNFPGSPWEPNAFLPVPRNRQVNPELPGNPWEANALPGRRHFFAAAPRPQATGRWKNSRKNRKTRRGSARKGNAVTRKNRKLRRSQRKNRK